MNCLIQVQNHKIINAVAGKYFTLFTVLTDGPAPGYLGSGLLPRKGGRSSARPPGGRWEGASEDKRL